jgi:hypothetical protein
MAAFFGVSVLLFAAACCAIVYFTNDRALLRFRRNPDPARFEAIRKDARQMVWAAFSFFGCFLLAGVITGLVVPLYIFAFILALLLWALFGASRKPLPPESIPSGGGGRLPYFMASYRGEGPGNNVNSKDPDVDKVFMAPAMLACAQVVNRMRKDGTLIPTFWNALPWKDAMFYDAFDVTAPDFLRLAPRNYQIDLHDVVHIKAIPDPDIASVGFKDVSGLIVLWHKSGKRNELVILGERDVKALADQLRGMVDALRSAAEPDTPPLDWAAEPAPPVRDVANP